MRLWLCKLLLPRGYAIWTWDDHGYMDYPVIEKWPRSIRSMVEGRE